MGVVFRPHPRRSLAVGFRQGQVFIDETWTKTNIGAASGMAPRGMRLMAKVPHGQKAKPYVQKRKTYLLQSRQVS